MAYPQGPGAPMFQVAPDDLFVPPTDGMWQDFRQRAYPYYAEDPSTMPPPLPNAPEMMGMPTMAPLPGMPGMPNVSLVSDQGPGPQAASPQGGSGGFSFSDIALPLAAGLAGAASGYATHGNPQTVLQGLSLAHRAQMMPRPEQLQQQQQQKMIHDLIMSGKLTPQALQRIGQQYPWAAPYAESMMPAAQDALDMRTRVRSMMGFDGSAAQPPAPIGPPPTGAQAGPSVPNLPAPVGLPGGGAQQFDYAPEMTLDSKGEVSMGMKPHARPKPSELEQRLAAVGQNADPAQAERDRRIALGLDKPLEEPPPLQTQRALTELDRQILALQQRLQMNPGDPVIGKKLNELINAREMNSDKAQFDPSSPTGKLLLDQRAAGRLGDPYTEQTLRAAATGSSRIPMESEQGKLGEDVRMLQQGRDMNAGDPQLQSMQSQADASALGKDVGNAVHQTQGAAKAAELYGADSPEAKNANTVLQRDVLKNQAPKPSDISQLRGDFMRQTENFNVTRDFYRQVETVLRSGNPNAMADLSFITAMAKIFDPGSVVRPSEADVIQNQTRIWPDWLKQTFNNWVHNPQLLTDTQRNDLINTVRQAYVSRLQSVDQLKNAYTAMAQRQFQGVNPDDIVGTVPYDAIDLAYLRGRPATMADIQAAQARATKAGQPALAPMLLLQQGINPFAEVAQ